MGLDSTLLARPSTHATRHKTHSGTLMGTLGSMNAISATSRTHLPILCPTLDPHLIPLNARCQRTQHRTCLGIPLCRIRILLLLECHSGDQCLLLILTLTVLFLQDILGAMSSGLQLMPACAMACHRLSTRLLRLRLPIAWATIHQPIRGCRRLPIRAQGPRPQRRDFRPTKALTAL